MQRASVFAFVVAVALAAGVDLEARSGGVVSALKQRSSAALLSRWQQRVGVAPRTKAWLQMGMAAAFCTTLACSGVTQSPEITGGAAPVRSAAPEVQRDNPAIIRTELFGEGFAAPRGLTYDSITAYQDNKAKLPLQFYDGMMIHLVENGKDFVRIVDLVGDQELKVRYLGHAPSEMVAFKTITGVLVGTHPDYGTRYVAFAAEFARSVNNDGGDQLLAVVTDGTTFYGEPHVIFSDSEYVITVYAFSLVGDQIRNFPIAVHFIVNAEHLVTIGHRSPRQLRQNNQTMAYYRADEGEPAALLVSDRGVFSSR